MTTQTQASAAGTIDLSATDTTVGGESRAATTGVRSARASVRLPLTWGRITVGVTWQPLAVPYAGPEARSQPADSLVQRLGELVRGTWRYFFSTVPWAAVIAGLVAALSAGMLGNMLTGGAWSPGRAATENGRTLLLVVAVLAVASFALFKLRFQLLGVRLLAHRNARARRGLILFVSTPTRDLPLVFGRHGPEVGGVILGASDVDKDTKALADTVDGSGRKQFWNWQQLLRAISPHKDKLDFLYLFGSVESQGQIRQAARLLKPYLRDRHTILLSPAGVDFEDLDAVMAGLKDAVSWLEARGLPRREILIDVTGGQKTASIAGALMSLNNRVNIQYVQTFGKDRNQVLEYDAEVFAPALT
jgi:CRISPR-associated protein (Cas_Cas02710)